jgi:hypothetical protein
MNIKQLIALIGAVIFLNGCSENEKKATITISSNVDHPMAIVGLNEREFPEILLAFSNEYLSILDIESGDPILYQWLEDELLLALELKGGKSRRLSITQSPKKPIDPEERTFARFVPERTDDFAWENDKVAFRTFGPDAKNRVVEGRSDGTLSSGIDVWHKKVNYPIINKWYYKELQTSGTYHKDDGEGADYYHVGTSRGVGGTGFWDKDTLYAAENFNRYELLAEGPVRTIFKLYYEPYQVGDRLISETKTISLDLGSQLSRFEVLAVCEQDSELPFLTAGVTLHENKGSTLIDHSKGIYAVWEPMEDTNLGTAIISHQKVEDYLKHISNHRDQSQLLVNVKPNENKFTFYAGFAWDQAGEITDIAQWKAYLNDFSDRLKNQPTVELIQKP